MSYGINGIIACHGVWKEYKQGAINVPVVQNVSLTFHAGQSYAITGVSGSGKSTLLHMLSGLEHPTSGTVMMNEHNLALFRPKHRQLFLNKTIGLMFQSHYLINELSVLENIMLAGMIRGERSEPCTQRAYQLLEMVDLTMHAHAVPSHLSGGQQQRVALARALFNKPSFVLADEPTGSLDANNASLVIDLLFAGQKEWGMGIIVSTHDSAVAGRMATEYRVGGGAVTLVRSS